MSSHATDLSVYAKSSSSSSYCLLVELKLCNVITRIGGKTGGLRENWGPQPRTVPV